MHINQLRESKYLKKEDCGNGILVTIKGLTQENMAMEGEPQEMRWVLHFMESIKPMALNSTNAQIISSIAKNDRRPNYEDTDSWPGLKVVLYSDPNISFAGKLVGGIRVRQPRVKQPAPVVAPPPTPAPMPYVEREAEADAAQTEDDLPPF